MSEDDARNPSYDHKQRMSDLELIRMADRDGEAFEILASERLRPVHRSIKEWCESAAEAEAAYREVAHAAIWTAVEYARYLKPDHVRFEPRDWLRQIAQIVLHTWIERDGRGSAPADFRPNGLTFEERARRQAEGELVRKHFEHLAIRRYREILQLVMIDGKSPEEAGRAMGMDNYLAARSFFRAALQELLLVIKEAKSPEDRAFIFSDPDRLDRCLERMPDPNGEFLRLIHNHSLSEEEAAAALGLDIPAGEEGRLLRSALRQLYELMLDDWRGSWSRPIEPVD
jgi:DNA-directed RNA polymerase specialized sigma24 family protein